MRPKHARPATKADETPAFQQFWQEIWPPVKSVYDARAKARDRWFHYVWWRDVDEADLLDGARYYVHNFKPEQLRKLASTWLDDGHYEDDAEKWRAYQNRQSEKAENVVSIHQPKTGNTLFLSKWNSGEFKNQA